MYVKLTQGGKSVACLDSSLLDEIILHTDISGLIKKQVIKAEKTIRIRLNGKGMNWKKPRSRLKMLGQKKGIRR